MCIRDRDNTAGTTGGNLNIANASAQVSVTDVVISGGSAMETSNDVGIVANGSISIGGSAALGNVIFAGAGSSIQITGALTAETAATIMPGVKEEDTVILTGTDVAAYYTRFELAPELQNAYEIGSDGLLDVKSYPVSLVIDGKATGYGSLESAMAAIPDNSDGTIILKEDIILTGNLTVNKNITLTDDGTRRTIYRGSSYTGIMITVNNLSLIHI